MYRINEHPEPQIHYNFQKFKVSDTSSKTTTPKNYWIKKSIQEEKSNSFIFKAINRICRIFGGIEQ